MAYFNAEQNKLEILSYLEKHPLSTVGEIACKYAPKTRRWSKVEALVKELSGEGKIESLFQRKKRFYYTIPTTNQEKDTLIRIIKSKKIFQSAFKKIKFEYVLDHKRPLFPQLVRQCISLFHLHLKIITLRKRKMSSKVRKKLTPKTIVSKFLLLLKKYSYEKIVIVDLEIRRRDRDNRAPKNPSQKNILVWLSDYICALYEKGIRYLELLKSGKSSKTRLREIINLLGIATNESFKDAAEYNKTELKIIRERLKPFLDERRFKSGELLTELIPPLKLKNGTEYKKLNNALSGLLFFHIRKAMSSSRYPYAPDLGEASDYDNLIFNYPYNW